MSTENKTVEALQDVEMKQICDTLNFSDFTTGNRSNAQIPSFLSTMWQEVLMEVRSNVRSGLTVSLVNLPLSISLAVASGTTPIAGVRTALFGGLMHSLLGGSQFNVVGPTGALSGILTVYAVEFGPDILPFLSVFAAVLVLLVFVLRLQKYISFMPGAVNHGFSLGVAFIIAGNQFNSLLGLKGLPLHPEFRDNLRETFAHIADTSSAAFVTFLLFFAPLFALSKKFRTIPWVIVVTILGILLGVFQDHFHVSLITVESRFGFLSPDLFSFPKWDSTWNDRIVDIIVGSVSVAFVAVLETLISGRIADGMARPSLMNARQEVLGLGVANLMCGFSGGLPATAALARTSLNIRSGATSRFSTLINVIAVGLISGALLQYFSYLPMPVIASMLVMVAVNMIEVRALVRLFKLDLAQFVLTLLVAAVCVAYEPTTGILVGAVLSLLRFAEQVSRGFSEIALTNQKLDHSVLDLNAVDRHRAGPRHDRKGTIFAGDENDSSGLVLLIQRWWAHATGRSLPGGFVLPRADAHYHLKADNNLEHLPVPVAQSRLQHSASRLDLHDPVYDVNGECVVYYVNGFLTYINGFAHAMRIRKLDAAKRIIISFKHCFLVDLDGLDAIDEAIREYESQAEHQVLLCGVTPFIETSLMKHQWFQKKQSDQQVFPHFHEAVLYHSTSPRGNPKERRVTFKNDSTISVATSPTEESKSSSSSHTPSASQSVSFTNKETLITVSSI